MSSGVPISDDTTAPIDGCEVMPDMESIATSTASAPALAAATMEITPVPAVSWVWMWMGRSGNSRRMAETSSVALCGVRRPAMSLMFSTWMPRSVSLRTKSR